MIEFCKSLFRKTAACCRHPICYSKKVLKGEGDGSWEECAALLLGLALDGSAILVAAGVFLTVTAILIAFCVIGHMGDDRDPYTLWYLYGDN